MIHIYTYSRNHLYTIVPTFLLGLLSLATNLNATTTVSPVSPIEKYNSVRNSVSLHNKTGKSETIVPIEQMLEKKLGKKNSSKIITIGSPNNDTSNIIDHNKKLDKLLILVADIASKNKKNLSKIVNFISDIKKDDNSLSLKEATESITTAIKRLLGLVFVLVIGIIIAFISNGKKVEDNIDSFEDGYFGDE